MGITQPRKKLGNIIFNPPTPHCLRHSFAVNTLKAIKERGASPQYALPVLLFTPIEVGIGGVIFAG
jgi:hypothetical protein